MNLKQLTRAQDSLRMRQMAAWQRIESQLQYAEFLVAQHADQAASFKPALTAARRAAEQGLAAEVPDMAATTAAVEFALAPLASVAKSYTVYFAGHAHIDMNWMWSWPETVSTTLDTFRTMLDLLREFP